MCGILGAVNIPFDFSDLDLMKHRGPDSFGIHRCVVNKHDITLGHRRLSIVELSEAGNQPMVSSCGNYWLIFNGEIYNHQILRNRLSGITFKGNSDTETILYYLATFGIESIKDFNGIFGLCFLDLIKNKLCIARDPNGVKPVYYSNTSGSFIFSSEIGPISQLLKQDDIYKPNLATLLKLRYNASPNTINKGINKLKPGEIIEVNLGSDILKYAHFSMLRPLPKTISFPFKNAVQTYKQVIEAAVERQLMSDVPVGVLLSGGIDSAIVAKIAREKLGVRIPTFTIGFGGAEKENEIQEAAETAKFLGLEHHFEKITFDDFLGTIQKCVSIVEEPLATTSFIPMYFLARLASQHVKVVLTGQGADEPLGGYRRYQGELVKKILPPGVLKALLYGIDKTKTKNESLSRASIALRENNILKRFESTYTLFSDKEIRGLIGINDTQSHGLISGMYDKLECKNKKYPVEQMMGLDVRMNLADDLLLYTDKITMHFSLECRVPLLDHELTQWIEALPYNYKLGIKKSKIIHKSYAKEFLPRFIINRKKKGFLSPTKKWFNTHISDIEDILLSKDTSFSTVFKLSEVEKILTRHKKGYNMEKQIFLFLNLKYWFDHLDEPKLTSD